MAETACVHDCPLELSAPISLWTFPPLPDCYYSTLSLFEFADAPDTLSELRNALCPRLHVSLSCMFQLPHRLIGTDALLAAMTFY